MPLFFFELHDSQIEQVAMTTGELRLMFSKAWLHPLLPDGTIDELEATKYRRAMLTFADPQVHGHWPDFDDDSYLSSEVFTVNGARMRLDAPDSYTGNVVIELLFVLGERVTVTSTHLQVTVL